METPLREKILALMQAISVLTPATANREKLEGQLVKCIMELLEEK